MFRQMKLAQMTLLLVAVPIVCEIGFVVWLYTALSDIETEAEKIEEARVVVMHINRLLRYSMDLMGKSRLSILSSEPVSTETVVEEMKAELRLLSSHFEHDQKQKAIFSRLNKCIDEGIAKAFLVKELVRTGDIAMAQDSAKQTKALLHDFAKSITELRIEQEEIENGAPHLIAKRRETMKNALTIGIGLNIFLAVALALIVRRNLVKRLQILSLNARLLKEQKPLEPSLGGADEIAQLDDAFHEMAFSLTLAREYEQLEALRLKQIVEGMPLGLVLFDEQGKIVMANTTLAQMLGKPTAEFTDTLISEYLTTPFDLQTIPSKAHAQVKRMDGSNFDADIATTTIETSEGKKVLMLVVDVSERMEMERLKQQFVAVVSHELRTPLSTVDNFLEMLKRKMYGELTEKGLERIDGVQRGVERLVKLTTDLLDAERLDSGTMKLEMRDSQLDDLIEQAREAVSGPAEKAGVTIVTRDIDINVRVDRERIIQVIINLLSNALKFSPQGSTIEIRARMESAKILVEVKDCGPGIKPGYEKRIFDRFQQVSIDDSKKRGGAGLGLAICSSIIEQHGGSIGVSSEYGKGSTFWFTIPVEGDQSKLELIDQQD